MDILSIARKLEPLRPKQVKHWLRIRDAADAELKALIDRQIALTAHKVLGDFHNKILLSLPPPHTARGTFHLGTVVYDKPRWPAGISAGELLQNMAVFGRSGAGKTNFVFHLLLQLSAKKAPFLFLDWKRTARHLLPTIKAKVNVFTPGRSLSPFPFNPFVPPPGLAPRVYAGLLIDVLADAYTLGDGARSLLERVLGAILMDGKAVPTLDNVLAHLEALPATNRARGWKESAMRALESLRFSEVTAGGTGSQQQLVQTLLHENTIIELDALTEGGKKFLIPLLCLWLYYAKLAAPIREKLSLVLILEEAHHVLYGQERRAREGVMNMLLRQCREIGIAMVVVDQHPHLMSSAALGNTFTSVCLNLKNPSDLNKAAALSMINREDDKQCFNMLPVGQAVVKLQNRWRSPFLIQVPAVPVAKGAVTDVVLQRYLRQDTSGSARNALLQGTKRQVQQVHGQDDGLDAEELEFLRDVMDYSDDGVRSRYQRLGLSGGRGNRIKNGLVRSGWVDAEVIPVGRTRKVILRVTPKANQALGGETKGRSPESVAHEYWKNFYAQRFAADGYHIEVEAALGNGRADVLAVKGAERVAVEVETGKSDVVANVRRALQAKVDRVLVVATNDEAFQRVERELASTGLLLPGRVAVLFRDQCTLVP